MMFQPALPHVKLSLLLVLTCLFVPGFPAAAGQQQSGYTALGDSYAAGVGADGTYDANNDCYQNDKAYPNVLQAAWNSQPWHFQACTGATTQLVDQCQVGSSVPPDDVACLSSRPDGLGYPSLISLTAGGDNIGFVDLLLECIYGLGNLANGGARGCENRTKTTDMEIAAFAEEKPLLATLQNIVVRSEIDGRQIYVTGYPSFWSLGGDCPPFSVFIDPPSPEFRLQMNTFTARLNEAIKNQTLAEEASYVDVEEAWNGHRWCEADKDADVWFNPVYHDFLDDTKALPTPNWVAGVFHPTPDGHFAYASRINEEAGNPPLLS